MSGVMLMWLSICSEFIGIHEFAPDCDQHPFSEVLNNGIKIERTRPLHNIKQPTIGICQPYPPQCTRCTRIWTYGNYCDLITFHTEIQSNEHLGKITTFNFFTNMTWLVRNKPRKNKKIRIYLWYTAPLHRCITPYHQPLSSSE
jgi:hypothetical protein